MAVKEAARIITKTPRMRRSSDSSSKLDILSSGFKLKEKYDFPQTLK